MISGQALTIYIYGLGLALGIIAGFVMHRSDYCVAGMFRDFFLFKNSFMLRTLFLQVVFTMVLFEAARLIGILPHYPFPLLGSPALSNIIGGVLFGIGMVLAGGCVVGTLYKMGAGSVVSAVAFVGLIVGSGLYAEIHPWWAKFIKKTTILAGSITVPQAANINPTVLVALLAVLFGFCFIKWYRDNRWLRVSEAEGYLQPWKAAIGLGVIGLGFYLLVGMPMGITTTYAKLAAMTGNLVAPEHFGSLAFFQATPLDIVHPAYGNMLKGGAGPHIDGVWMAQFPIISGIILGSMLSAVLLREFAIHWRVPPSQLLMVFVGGILLGLAARLAPACNVWHLMGGLPILAMQSILFVIGLIPGAWIGSKIVSAIILRQTTKAAGHPK